MRYIVQTVNETGLEQVRFQNLVTKYVLTSLTVHMYVNYNSNPRKSGTQL